MDTLYALVSDPSISIVIENCDHRHRTFRHDQYDFECQRCGQIFDDDETSPTNVVR